MDRSEGPAITLEQFRDLRHRDAVDCDDATGHAAFEVLAEQSRYAIALVRADDDTILVTFANAKLSRLTGYATEQLTGSSFTSLLDPSTDQAVLERIAHNARLGRPVTADVEVTPRSGPAVKVQLTCTPIPSVAGNHFVATVRDVSQENTREARLRRRVEWAQAIIGGINDVILVADDDFIIRWTSPNITERLGYEPTALIGMAATEIVHPDDVERGLRALRATAKGGSIPASVFRVHHHDGTWRSFSITASKQTEYASVSGIVITAADVTEMTSNVTSRMVIEELMAEQADLLDAIARGAPLEITLQRITQMIEHVMDGSHCAIGVLEANGSIRCHAAPNVPPPLVSYLDELEPHTEAGVALRDSDGEPLVYDFRGGALGTVGEMFRDHGYQMTRVAPVRASSSDEMLGSIQIFHEDGRDLTAVESEALSRALNLSAIAIERRRLESTLQHQSLYDPLTGLPNRTLLRTRTEDALNRSRRLSSGVAVLFVDLDRFKVINDSMGHEVGDRLLVQVAARLQASLRPGDTLARFGGDEFMVVCSRIPDAPAASIIAERLMAQLATPFQTEAGEVFVTASIGIACTDDITATAESMIRDADVAMYRAKDQGRNQYVVFEQNLDQYAVEKLALEQAIRHGIDNHEFELHFQPVVRLADGAMTHVEALARWHRPGHDQLVFPGDFIPLAEETGLIVPLGWQVLEQACAEAAAWPQLPDGTEVEVAVNLSARQLASEELIPTVRRVLAETALGPHRLCFEVTESALVGNIEQAKQALLDVKALGVRLAIDDFGTGYASLEYVRHFTMADYLKIDRSFVDGVDRVGSHEAAIVSAAIALARSLGLTVIAEGVETPHQMEALQQLDCELAQGYLFSRPIPAAAAIDLLAAGPAAIC